MKYYLEKGKTVLNVKFISDLFCNVLESIRGKFAQDSFHVQIFIVVAVLGNVASSVAFHRYQKVRDLGVSGRITSGKSEVLGAQR